MSDQGPVRPMTATRFAAILDAYGSAARRWPEAERAAAQALLAASPEARGLLADAARLDGVLSAATAAPEPSAALRAAVLRAAPKPAVASRPGFVEIGRGLWRSLAGVLTGELGGLRPAGAVLGVALMLGVVAGGALESQTGATPVASAPTLDLVELALFDDSYGDF